MSDIQAVNDFWLNEVGPKGWYVASDDVDNVIRERFGALLERAKHKELEDWRETPEGTLALLILLDQFSRNLHRGEAEAFAADAHAREIARDAVSQNLDLAIPEPQRQIFYLPFEHSENIADQDWSVALFQSRMEGLPDQVMFHIKKHRELIQQFGRFPFRNAALGRQSTKEEATYLAEGGYVPGKKS